MKGNCDEEISVGLYMKGNCDYEEAAGMI